MGLRFTVVAVLDAGSSMGCWDMGIRPGIRDEGWGMKVPGMTGPWDSITGETGLTSPGITGVAGKTGLTGFTGVILAAGEMCTGRAGFAPSGVVGGVNMVVGGVNMVADGVNMDVGGVNMVVGGVNMVVGGVNIAVGGVNMVGVA